jgi:hypothetical protein
MHKLLLVGLSAAVTLFGAALLPERADAITLTGATGVGSAGEQLGIIEKVDRVCRRFCDEGFCRTRCFDDDDRRFRGRDDDRRFYRDRDDDRRFYRERDRDRDRRDCTRIGPAIVCN